MTSTPISFDNVKTQEQAAALLLLLSEIVNMEYKTHETVATLQSAFSPDTLHLFQNVCQANSVDTTQKEKLVSFAKEAKTFLEQLPVISCTIAFAPSPSTVDSMYEQIQDIVKNPFLLAYEEDPTLIAGITFSVNGKFYDYSARKKAQQALQTFL